MARSKTHYICSECGHITPKWMGRCPECGEWDSFEEKSVSSSLKSGEEHRIFSEKKDGVVTHVNNVDISCAKRISSTYNEIDRITGGGIVRGSYNLISGHPGVGKSTLMLQVALALAESEKVLYLSAEESISQVKIRFSRLTGKKKAPAGLYLSNINNIDKFRDHVIKEKFSVVFIDSIQTVYSPSIRGIPGSVSQIKECSVKILEFCKSENITVFVIGHVTKQGSIAGPMLLEHMVDAVLLFEGDPTLGYRVLRTSKNRFGATNEIGIFSMSSKGLLEVEDPSTFFTSPEDRNMSGAAKALILEGSRPLVVEIQALCTTSNYSQPRRVVTGLDSTRFSMITAVLEKRGDIICSNYDMFLNVVGGLQIKTPAVDLPIAAALLSAVFDITIPSDIAFVGETGLAGEIRDVPGMDIMIREGARHGLKKICMPEITGGSEDLPGDVEIVVMKSIYDLIEEIRSLAVFER
ncbi:MAG: DNA repair protein RadA [bacterium]